MTATLTDRASTAYTLDLMERADKAAELADELTLGYIARWAEIDPDQRLALMESIQRAARERDAYRQQVDYYLHLTNTPAWRD